MWSLKNLKISTKIKIVFVAISAAAAVTTSVLLTHTAIDTSTLAFEQQTKKKLLSAREAKKAQLQRYFADVSKQLKNLAVLEYSIYKQIFTKD